MTIEQLYAEERRLEGELESVREQIREHINRTGSNKVPCAKCGGRKYYHDETNNVRTCKECAR